MPERPDGRAVFAAICAVFSLPVSVNPFFPLIFAPIGVLSAIASIAFDELERRSTRALALVASVLCIAFFAVGLHGALVHPHVGGE